MPSVFLPFWPKGTVSGNNFFGGSMTTYTDFYETRMFSEVIAQLSFDSAILNPGGASSITVTPQVSSDCMQWEDQTSFAAITSASSYPTKESIKISEISEYMRFKIVLSDAIAGGFSGGTFSLYAVGRWEDD